MSIWIKIGLSLVAFGVIQAATLVTSNVADVMYLEDLELEYSEIAHVVRSYSPGEVTQFLGAAALATLGVISIAGAAISRLLRR
jgi:hypothetical protein